MIDLTVLIYTSSYRDAIGFSEDSESRFGDPLIFVSVISARDHFEHRQSIRETWGKWTSDAALKFIVGRECPVPPDDREYDQGCTEIIWQHG